MKEKKRTRIAWTEDMDSYLRKQYPKHDNLYCLKGLRRKGYRGSADTMMKYANRVLGLRKDPVWKRERQSRLMRECIEKRGEDFNERQRQRALNDPNWFGGHHNNGNNMSRERRVEICNRVLHTPEVRARIDATRRKTLERDKRRVSLGLDQITKMPNIGDGLTALQKKIRYQMKYECGYITFRYDKRIYYDDVTKRSARREKTAEERGLYVYPLSEHAKFVSEK